MNYCTTQHLIDAHGETELIQLTDRTGLGVIDNGIVNAALDKADSLINQRLRTKGWTLPLTDSVILSSADLKNLAVDITRYYLHGHLPEIPKQVQADFDLVLKTLADYVKGVLTLDIGEPPSAVNTGSGAGDVDFSAPERVFTEESLRGF